MAELRTLNNTVGSDDGGACWRGSYYFVRAESAVLGVSASRKEALDQGIRQFERQVADELSRESLHLERLGERSIADVARDAMLRISRQIAPLFAESNEVDFEIQGLEDGGAVFIADNLRRARRLVIEVRPDGSLIIKRVDNNSAVSEAASVDAPLDVPIRWLRGF